MEIFLKEKEKLNYFTLNNASTNIYLAKESHLCVYSFTFGEESVKNNLNVILEEEQAKAELYGLYLVSDGQIAENNTFLRHLAPFCQSFQQYYGILAGKGRAVFNGRIRIERKAKGTDAYLENKNILLSNDAEVLGRPFLEIFDDDVKCTHAFSASLLEEDEIFYLRSRGIDKETAKKILLTSFAKKIINKVNKPSLKENLCAKISQFLTERLEAKN